MAAKLAYDSLDDRQKELVGEEYAKQVAELFETATNFVVTDGADGEFTKGESKELEFAVNGPIELLAEVLVDGEVLSENNYSVSDDNTIVLNAEYLEDLSEGEHSFAAAYKVKINNNTSRFTAECEFTIIAEQEEGALEVPTEPESESKVDGVATGDSANLIEVSAVLLISLFVVIVVLKKKKEWS